MAALASSTPPSLGNGHIIRTPTLRVVLHSGYACFQESVQEEALLEGRMTTTGDQHGSEGSLTFRLAQPRACNATREYFSIRDKMVSSPRNDTPPWPFAVHGGFPCPKLPLLRSMRRCLALMIRTEAKMDRIADTRCLSRTILKGGLSLH